MFTSMMVLLNSWYSRPYMGPVSTLFYIKITMLFNASWFPIVVDLKSDCDVNYKIRGFLQTLLGNANKFNFVLSTNDNCSLYEIISGIITCYLSTNVYC